MMDEASVRRSIETLSALWRLATEEPKTMKTAKAIAQTITLDCPNCAQPMLTPSGRVMVWWSDDFTGLDRIQCQGCGEVCKFPETAVTNAGTVRVSSDEYFDDPIGQRAT